MDPSLPPVDTWSYLLIAQQSGSNIWHESKQKERSKLAGLSSRITANIQWLIPFGYYFHINVLKGQNKHVLYLVTQQKCSKSPLEYNILAM
jgi:hypothetical protein